MKDSVKKVIVEWQERRAAVVRKRAPVLVYSEEINAVAGLRRSGKTYFIFSQIETLLKNGLDPTAFMYINFDDERLVELKARDLDIIMEAYFELYPENKDKELYLFFDEIQDVEHWHLFIKRLYEQKRYKITITGSSSRFLGTEIATQLRGRTRTLNFFPLTFREFLSFKDFEVPRNVAFSSERFQVVKYAEEFMRWGGFPRVAAEPSDHLKKEILKDYLEMIIFKDISERYGVRNKHLLRLIIDYTLTNFASEFSVNGFIKKFQSEYRLNKDTVFTYFSYLEDVGFLYYLPRFSYKAHQRYVNKKNYIADNGFIFLLSYRGMEVSGRVLENLVFTELLKRKQELFYHKDSNNHECDFIMAENEAVTGALQVCLKLTPENKDREVRGLIAALKAFGLSRGIIVTKDGEEEIRESSYEISVMPYWKWMLSLPGSPGGEA